MNVKTLFKTTLLTGFAFAFMLPSISFAAPSDQLNDVKNQIKATENKLEESKRIQGSLSAELKEFDKRTTVINDEIKKSEGEIYRLESEITQNIGETEETKREIKENQVKLGEVLRVSYEESQISLVELIASSNSFSDFVSRKEYVETTQFNVKEVGDKMIALKAELESSKKELEQKQKKGKELLILKEEQKSELANEKRAKAEILAQTKGQEAKYQNLKRDLEAKQKAIEEEIWKIAIEEARARQASRAKPIKGSSPAVSSGGYVSYGAVRAGDIIGYQGNSGFSSGTHLHFEIRNPSQAHVNPANYLGNGYFIHPIPGARVNQGYGYTTWWAYSFHTGIDYSKGFGTPIRAVAPGTIIKRVTGKGNTYPGSPDYGNYVLIRHTNGWYSLYGHLK